MGNTGKYFPHDRYDVRIGSDKMIEHDYTIKQFDLEAGLDEAEQIAIGRFYNENPNDKIHYVAVSLARKVR